METLRAELLPKLEEFEVWRKCCIKNFNISLGVILVLLVGVLLWIHSAQPEDNDVYLIPAFLAIFVAAGAFHFATSGYRKSFKVKIIRPVVESYLEQIEYSPHDYVSMHAYEQSKIFLRWPDRYKGEDYIRGTKGKTDFEFSELHTEYKTTTRTKNGTRTTYHTIFRGVFFIADFHKDFNGRTLVLPDTVEGILGKFGQMLQDVNFTRPDLVKLEDPEFEKAFCVYSEDQVEARYILSTSLMRRILDYKHKFGNDIYLSFYRSRVYVALSCNRNRFEPRIFQSVTKPGLLKEYLSDLELLVDIIDDLNLNLRIWSKE